MMPYMRIPGVSADPETVKKLTDRLIEAFDALGPALDGAREIDVMMAVHNFHKFVIVSMEGRMRAQGSGENEATMVRAVAVDTFGFALLGDKYKRDTENFH